MNPLRLSILVVLFNSVIAMDMGKKFCRRVTSKLKDYGLLKTDEVQIAEFEFVSSVEDMALRNTDLSAILDDSFTKLCFDRRPIQGTLRFMIPAIELLIKRYPALCSEDKVDEALAWLRGKMMVTPDNFLFEATSLTPTHPIIAVMERERYSEYEMVLLESYLRLCPFASESFKLRGDLKDFVEVILANGGNLSPLDLEMMIKERISSKFCLKPVKEDPIVKSLMECNLSVIKAGPYGTLGIAFGFWAAMGFEMVGELAALARLAAMATQIRPVNLQNMVNKVLGIHDGPGDLPKA